MPTQPCSNRRSGLFYLMQPQESRRFSQSFSGHPGDVNFMGNALTQEAFAQNRGRAPDRTGVCVTQDGAPEVGEPEPSASQLEGQAKEILLRAATTGRSLQVEKIQVEFTMQEGFLIVFILTVVSSEHIFTF